MMTALVKWLEMTSKLPNYSQSFTEIRRNQRIYVDKTMLIYALAFDSKPHFLSRPRRFGKSTLVNTLDELFRHGISAYDGHASYFKGLAIEKLWRDQGQYLILNLDFSLLRGREKGDFERELSKALDAFAVSVNIPLNRADKRSNHKFENILKHLEHTKLVLLVDEYDSPLTEFIDYSDDSIIKENTLVLREFLSLIKSYGDRFRCVFITGITRFKDTSIASVGNNIEDISQNPIFAEICGYTREEIRQYFPDHLRYFAAKMQLKDFNQVTDDDIEKLLDFLASCYDGYYFAKNRHSSVFSTWSILSYFANASGDFDIYWYNSGGTPTVLLKSFFKNDFVQTMNSICNNQIEVPVERIINPASLLSFDTRVLLFQTGYLTLAEPMVQNTLVDLSAEVSMAVKLCFPNNEIRFSFKRLLQDYIFAACSPDNKVFNFASDLRKSINSQNLPNLINIFNKVLNTVDYEHYPIKEESMLTAVLSIFAHCCGLYVSVNAHQSSGRADCVIKAEETSLVLEFKFVRKLNEAEAALTTALEQIRSHQYGETLSSDGRIWQVAAVFSQEDKRLVSFAQL